ncbi:DUF2599 domain-containing protein [Corynebacterium choanae]|uniref:DUF2599 domain-containing protein n=1 Tax=Corynebacterium choanae TaxID=1862358 RepID=A0A3G6J3T7_9CORY|nr:DUF2599 domain-containing protein [Corynebacterium choanae]AZA12677.1 hypothetical protein CCHOA_01245 [Corynebacterium choanae]
MMRSAQLVPAPGKACTTVHRRRVGLAMLVGIGLISTPATATAIPTVPTAPPVSGVLVADAALDNAVEQGTVMLPERLQAVAQTFGGVVAVASDLPPAIAALLAGAYMDEPVTQTVTVVPTDQGNRYQITPAPGVTELPVNARYAGWLQAIALGVPDTPTLRHQYYCHFDGRAALVDKPTWNIEDFRPDKGMDGFYASLCN